MKITKEELIELGACEEGLDRFIIQTNDTDEPVEASSLVGGENIYSDLLWLAGKKLTKDRIVRFACDCALINIEMIKPYTDKYDMIVDFLRNPATHVATDAADAARAAAYAATDVYAYSVAYAVARVAGDGATHAVYVTSAADAAIRAAYGNRDKVDELLKELFA